jgi:class 3 adenylate cyclase/tetratricopeptide (TPR) repeat protein
VEITCPACGAAEQATARFCSACGTSLQLVCPSCGETQPASSSFCATCGSALRGDPASRTAAVDERQERRVVSILFADLAGSTALGERLDPEDVREIQGGLFETVNAEVERFGGVTEKFVGDAVLAVFGIPRAHEDDPERAVRAGLAAQAAFASFAATIADRYGVEVGLRIGINTGDVVAGRQGAARGELMVSGDAVNVAARIQQAAEPGQVLVGSRTRRATTRSVGYGDEQRIDAKGKSTALAAWPAESVTLDTAPRGIPGLSSPFIARSDELAILTAVIRRAVRERAPQLLTLLGAAGVGKSRLVAELVSQLPETQLLEGRCVSYGEDVTYRPLADALKAHAGVLDSDPAVTAREKISRHVQQVVGPDTARVLAPILWTIGLELPIGLSTGEVTQWLEEAWRKYLAGLANDRPTILAIEDVHWASPALLDLIDRLADSLSDSPVVIACTSRPELLELRPNWGAGTHNATTLTLAPLAPNDASDLVNALLGRDGSLEALGRRVLEQAEGNPFFVEEMLAMLIDRKALVRANGAWHVDDDLAELPLPDSVHGVIAARIDLLETADRDALRRASIVGRVFWPPAVGLSDEAAHPLMARGLVTERTSSMSGMREFGFKHALTRDVAYASVPRGERRTLHRQVAEWIQEVAPDRGLEVAELAAHHYAEALGYGENDPALRQRAAEVFLTAGEGALQRASLGSAARHLERALELATSPRLRGATLIDLAKLAFLSGGVISTNLKTAEEHLDDALDVLPVEEAELRGDALAWSSRVHWLSGRWESAVETAENAVAELRGLPESPQLARALARRSQLAMLSDSPDAESLSRDALTVANRVGDRFATVNAAINVMTVGALHGTAPNTAEVLQLIATAREIGATEEAYRALVNLGWSSAGYVPVDDVLETIAAGEAILENIPRPGGLGGYLPMSIVLIHLLPSGRLDEAERLLAATDVDDLNVTTRMLWLGVRAQLLIRRGNVADAGPLVSELRGLTVGSGEPQRVIPMACAYLPWAVLSGAEDQLRDVAGETIELVGARWAATLTTLPAIRALSAAGATDLLARWADGLDRGPSRTGRLGSSSRVARGLLALHDGRHDDAIDLLSDAAAADRDVGYVFDAASIELELAAALDAAGDRDRASALREASEAYFASIGCVHAL